MAEFIPKSKDLYFVNGINDPGKFGTKTPTGNSRLYNCNQCDRAFTRYEHLSRHVMSTHNKLKPFACGICHRAFSRRDLLLRHAKNLHGGSELAVPRIRKQVKKSSDEERSEDDKSEEDRSEDELPSFSPEGKRLKLSVDMLVG